MSSPDATGRGRAPSDPLQRVLDEFIAHASFERGLSPNTVAAYRRDLAAWIRYCEIARVDPMTARAGDVTDYLQRLRDGRPPANRPMTQSTVARMLVALRSLYRFGVGEELLDSDPTATVASPKPVRSLPKALSVEDIERLLESPAADLLGRRDRAILEVLYGAGLRISELVDLDIDDVDLAAGTVLVRAGKGNKSRLVPVGRAGRKAVGDYLTAARPELVRRGGTRSAGPALFLNARGGRLSRQGCWKILKGHARTAGIERLVSPHTLRHSCATHMLDRGADIRVVQELLGHASLATTQVYTLVTDRRLREVYLASHPRARG